jgi:hypothetical protein
MHIYTVATCTSVRRNSFSTYSIIVQLLVRSLGARPAAGSRVRPYLLIQLTYRARDFVVRAGTGGSDAGRATGDLPLFAYIPVISYVIVTNNATGNTVVVDDGEK